MTADQRTAIEYIENGAFDGQERLLYDAIQRRLDFNNSRLLLNIKPGDLVRFNEKTRPNYYIGLKAEVLKVNRKTVKVMMIDSRGRILEGMEVNTPVSTISKIAEM